MAYATIKAYVMQEMEEIRVSCRWRNDDHRWTMTGAKITSPDNLAAIRDAMETRGSLVLQHWFYCGSCCPDRMIFDDFDDLLDYLKNKTSGGDAIDLWLMHDLCKQDNRFLEGKIPDEDGCVPEGGAY